MTNPGFQVNFDVKSYVWNSQNLINLGSGQIVFPKMTMKGGSFKPEGADEFKY